MGQSLTNDCIYFNKVKFKLILHIMIFLNTYLHRGGGWGGGSGAVVKAAYSEIAGSNPILAFTFQRKVKK